MMSTSTSEPKTTRVLLVGKIGFHLAVTVTTMALALGVASAASAAQRVKINQGDRIYLQDGLSTCAVGYIDKSAPGFIRPVIAALLVVNGIQTCTTKKRLAP